MKQNKAANYVNSNEITDAENITKSEIEINNSSKPSDEDMLEKNESVIDIPTHSDTYNYVTDNHMKVPDNSQVKDDTTDNDKNINTLKYRIVESEESESESIQENNTKSRKPVHEMYFLPAGHGLSFGFHLGELKKSRSKMEIYSHNQIHSDITHIRLFV